MRSPNYDSKIPSLQYSVTALLFVTVKNNLSNSRQHTQLSRGALIWNRVKSMLKSQQRDESPEVKSKPGLLKL